MNSIFIIGCSICLLAEICHPKGRQLHERRIIYFDNSPIYNAEVVQECLAVENSGEWIIQPIVQI
jgi:hypothetical protein